MVYYKTDDEIELIRESSLLVGKALAEVAKNVAPGITTGELDLIAEAYIRDNGGQPGFKNYRGFPATLCTSVNDAVVHGIPNDSQLKDGDVVSVDCGVKMNGFYGDSAYTFMVGEVSPETKKLLEVTKESLALAIEQAVAGNRIGDIGFAVQQHAENHGYGVVRELVGHGLGRQLHEAPEIPNYGRRGHGKKLQEGLVIAIEPMINAGARSVKQDRDGWTILTADQSMSAHYEHTIVVKRGRAEKLSTFEYIEEVING